MRAELDSFLSPTIQTTRSKRSKKIKDFTKNSRNCGSLCGNLGNEDYVTFIVSKDTLQIQNSKIFIQAWINNDRYFLEVEKQMNKNKMTSYNS